MNGDQLRMARALLRLGIRQLALLAGVDKNAIVRMEAGRKPHNATVQKIRQVLEERGVVFIGATEPFHEPTVAMRYGMTPPPPSEDEAEEEEAEEPAQRALAWDESDFTLESGQIERMRAFWSGHTGWEKLTPVSRRALTQFMGGAPLK